MYFFLKNVRVFCHWFIFLVILGNLVTECISRSPHKNKICKSQDFYCASGHCISKYLICDGVKHCPDGSDETEAVCSKIYCPNYMFRCEYGGCLRISTICNGIVDCIDGSDEPPINSCKIPSYAPIKVTSRQTTSKPTSTKVYTPFNPTAGTTPSVTPSTQSVTEKTTKNYTPFNPNPNSSPTRPATKSPIEVPSSSEAIQPGWCQLPEKSADQNYVINDCARDPSGAICDRKPGQYVDQFSVLTLECNPNHYSSAEDVSTTFCLDGKWTPPVVHCEECGLTNVQESANDNYVPWLVAIYDSQKSFSICWGTLTSHHTVITAAHCMFDESSNEKRDTSNFFVMVGKHLTSGTEDDDTRQYRIASIILLDDSYRGASTNYQANIAVLEMDSKIAFSNYVKPVCVDWKNNFKFNPNDGTRGFIPAWTINRQLAVGELHPQQYPFISNRNCANLATASTRSLLTDDKFCVTLDPGTTVDSGNAGNGFFLYSPNRRNSHLFGVVSSYFLDPSNTPVLIITDINKYRDKLKTIVDEIKERRKSDEFIDVRFPNAQPTTKKSKT